MKKRLLALLLTGTLLAQSGLALAAEIDVGEVSDETTEEEIVVTEDLTDESETEVEAETTEANENETVDDSEEEFEESEVQNITVNDTEAQDEIPEYDIWLADSYMFGIDKSGDSLYSLLLGFQDPVYLTLGQNLIEDDTTFKLASAWSVLLNDDMRKNPNYLYETIIMDYLVFQSERSEFNTEMANNISSFSSEIYSAMSEEYGYLTEVELDKYTAQDVRDCISASKSNIENFNLAIKTVSMGTSTAKEYIKDLSNYLALLKVKDERIALLNQAYKVASSDKNAGFCSAVIEIKTIMSSSVPQYLSGETVEHLWGLFLDACWEQTAAHIPGLGLGKAGLDVLFNTSGGAENDLKLAVLYLSDSYFRRGLFNSASAYRSNSTAENGRNFSACMTAYAEFQIYGNTYAKKWIQNVVSGGCAKKWIEQLMYRDSIEAAENLIELSQSQIEVRQRFLEIAGKYGEIYGKEYGDENWNEYIGTSSDASAKSIIGKGTCGADLIWVLYEDGTLYITGTGPMTDWQTDYARPWFAKRNSIKKVQISHGVTSIGVWAFYDCNSLTSVTIGNDVTSIGDGAFRHCTSLLNVTIPNSVTSIGDYAFAVCDSLRSVPIPDSVTSIGNHAFDSCIGLTSVTIPDSVTSIGDSAFIWCSSLTSVSIPDSVTSIGDCAFRYCTGLMSVTIPDSVTSIGDYAFEECTSLTSVTIGNSVTSIGDYAFDHCATLPNVTIPNSVTSIGARAFYNCSSMTSVSIPNSVSSIGVGPFAHCDSLTNIMVDSGNPNYLSQDGVLYNKDKTTLIQYPIGNSRTSFAIPNSVTSIGDSAFSGCDSLTSVTIPNSVTSIGKQAFSDCSNLTSVTIPDSVTKIGWYAFAYCSSLTSATIGNGVTRIEAWAFAHCATLPNVTIPNSVTSIDSWAFEYCDCLTSVTIPDSVTSIEDYAFEYCDCLTDVYYTGSEEQWNAISIGRGNTDLTSAAIHYNWKDETHTHTWDSGTVTKAATCTADGVKTFACTSCDETKTEAITKLGHKYGSWTVTTKPTCTVNGVETRVCKNDSSHKETREVDALGHNWDSGKVTKAATCGAAGVKTYTCSRCKTLKTETIPATGNHTYKTTTTKAKPGANGKTVTKCSTCGTVKSTTTIYAPETLTLSKTSYTYNGKTQKPTVTVKDSKGNTISSTHYTVSYASGCKYVGKYKVTVAFKSTSSKYSGTLSAYFTINPKGTTLQTPTAGSKSFTAKWTKQSTQTSGYQLQYSTSSKFTNAKTVTISGTKTTSKKITKLTAKKKYYVRIRTYKTVSGTKYYSAWSSVKTVTTKK